MAAEAEAQPPARGPGAPADGDRSGAVSAGAEGERYGPLRVERLRKDDGRALILYSVRPGDRAGD